MASDSLNQIGKYLKDTRNNSDYALKKQRPDRPTIERTRDIFDPDIPFSMEFQVKNPQKSINLDLEFNKPPPLQGCRSGTGLLAHCETFILSAGDHEIQLQESVKSATVAVFVNGATWEPSKWTILDEGIVDGKADLLVLQLPLITNQVTICYMEYFEQYYTGDAFAALLNPNAAPYPLFAQSGDNPPAGWYGEPTVGPITPNRAGAYWGSITVNVDMIVRVEATARQSGVGGIDRTFILSQNGNDIGAEQFSPPPGFWSHGYSIDLHNVECAAGDTFSVRFVNNFNWGGLGTNGEYLRVGRGTFVWLNGNVTWTGP